MLKEKQRFSDVEAADIIKQVCTGLDYIHHERIIHRDIKPENIIMHMVIDLLFREWRRFVISAGLFIEG